MNNIITIFGLSCSKINLQGKQLRIGRKKFNMDPKKGIEYLIDNNLLINSPEGKFQSYFNTMNMMVNNCAGKCLGECPGWEISVLRYV